MVAKEGVPPVSRLSAVRAKAVPRMDQPFDHWLHKQLHAMYDSIAKEPLPDDLMQLIDGDAAMDIAVHHHPKVKKSGDK